ncbi:actin-interacting protein 1 isoform X3 [Plutella xylostella]|uniref:actin-interacting protein 1 isoform X1 n=1 Tax=Plutella xylostella TaxID=51655 RepID=UPI002032B25D|nr:actin-interacting protein 1 isoform X1 [Plutella xylostella]XP_048478169.1 actin-interacting protein 1 isoform X2 [Plutella xylostella]XP_048478171.1 actin-interacting protein 1 isoform X3 [Plutella xylostella]
MSYSNKYTFAALPRTARGTPLVLGGDPKGKTFLYTNGNSVIIRDIENPAIADTYTEHSCQVNVAKYSPSGFYIASGDASGKIRIWDTVNKEHILKNEFQPIGGCIKDIAWSADNQRMVAVGEGRERFGHVFMSETGTSVGEISGQAKPINSVDFRPARPFRIVTASEDNTLAVFEGPPFKFKCTKQEHTRFAQAVRYSPDGSQFASAGFDGKIFLYDGTTSELKGEIGSPAHKGGVYGIAWSPDGTQLLSCSGDKTCAVWDVASRERVTTFNMGQAVENQQVSCLWQGKHLISVSLSGVINYLDVNNPDTPLRTLVGHNKPITCLAVHPDRHTVYTASHDGTVTAWNVNNGEGRHITGAGHGNQVNGMRATRDGGLLTCGIDDSLRVATPSGEGEVPHYTDAVVPLGSQPRAMDHILDDGTTIIATVQELIVVIGGSKQSTLPLKYEPTCVAIDPKTRHVAVGGADNIIRVYTLDVRTLTPSVELTHLGPITDVRYSPDSAYLVATDANRKVILYSTDEYKLAHNKEWGFHTARVNCASFSPDSRRVASGSLDTNVIVWSVDQPAKHVVIKNAHPQSQITGIAWLDDETIVSVGQDANTRVWTVPKA